MVTVTVPASRGTLRRRVTAAWSRCGRMAASARRRVRAAVSAAGAGLLAVRALAGLALVAFGAWLAWEPAGFMVAGVGLLADRLLDERAP